MKTTLKLLFFICLLAATAAFSQQPSTVPLDTASQITAAQKLKQKLIDLENEKMNATIKTWKEKADKINARLTELEGKIKEASKKGELRRLKRKLRRQERKAERHLSKSPISIAKSKKASGNCVSCHKHEKAGSFCGCSRVMLGLPMECSCDSLPVYSPCFLFNKIVKDYNFNSRRPRYMDVFGFSELLMVMGDTMRVIRESIQLKATAKKLNKEFVSSDSKMSPGLTIQETLDRIKQEEKKVSAEDEKQQEFLKKMIRDSIDLKNCIIGKQSFSLGNIILLQNYPDLPDDNPVTATQLFAGYNLPIRKIRGKLVCNYKKPGAFFVLRNIYFSGALTPFNDKNKDFSAQDTFLINRLGQTQRFVNTLDLYQYSRFRMNASLNLVSFITRFYNIYADANAGMCRTWVARPDKSTTPVNFLHYGFDVTIRTRFDLPLNLVVKYKLFSIDPNSNMFNPGLNPQYRNLATSSASQTREGVSGLPYTSLNLTFQYTLDGSQKDLDPGSSARGSDAKTMLYVSIGYVTNKVFGKRHGLDYNNYFTFQIGYSRSINDVFNGVKSILGLGKEEGKAAAEVK